jgi:glycosyltransferase involved in cell wall biosynthesis
MRVTHIITRLIVGGAQENTIATVLGLHRLPGFSVRLISGPTTGPEGSLEPAVSGVPGLLQRCPHLCRPIHPWHDAVALWQLIRWLRADAPDIVHTHSGKAGILGRLAARCARVPIIVHTIHGPSFGPFQGACANLILRAAERFAARFTTQFVVVANAMAAQYLAAGMGTPDRYTRILSGFDLDPFLTCRSDPSLRRRFGIEPADIVVGKIARLCPLKGHDELLDVAAALARAWPQIKFLLVGGGPWQQRLEQRARDLGIAARVRFTGLVPPEQIPACIGIMDLLVHLSRREGLARALPQALAAGRPVIAYDCDGAREVCRGGETGFLVAPGDVATLEARIQTLAADPDLRHRLGANGRALVREVFTVERMVEDTRRLYQTLLQQHAQPSPAPRPS